ncbi:UNVERIFIED_CONTAM: hypothetical protein PYX00_005986 [Menopon gallinae]|uniref:Uncharacterized protein n=1 Tax=Menopon gallinae TaxID=328185 RepID=A0AAW2HUU3_9NEOP
MRLRARLNGRAICSESGIRRGRKLPVKKRTVRNWKMKLANQQRPDVIMRAFKYLRNVTTTVLTDVGDGKLDVWRDSNSGTVSIVYLDKSINLRMNMSEVFLRDDADDNEL